MLQTRIAAAPRLEAPRRASAVATGPSTSRSSLGEVFRKGAPAAALLAGHACSATPLAAAQDRLPELPRRGAPVPAHPIESRKRGEAGEVRTGMRLDAAGTAERTDILEGPGFPASDHAAVADRRFRPALRGGKPVPGTMTTTTRFRLGR